MKFDSNGLIPMIIQDAITGAVLSLFYGNAESIKKMKETGFVYRYSRSKQKVMKKGEESGNVQKVKEIIEDCDSDALLVRVNSNGPACHIGSRSCFGNTERATILSELSSIIQDRKSNPKIDSYTSSIVNSRDAVIRKLREECEELIVAEKKSDIKWEAADLLYFILVYLENRTVTLEEVLGELNRRRK